jgi:hypothetical protein
LTEPHGILTTIAMNLETNDVDVGEEQEEMEIKFNEDEL